MTWISGSCETPLPGTTAEDAERAPLGLVRGLREPNPDDVEVDRELYARVAETHPGIVRTLSLLVGELAEVDDIDPPMLRVLGDRVRRVGDTLVARAARHPGCGDDVG